METVFRNNRYNLKQRGRGMKTSSLSFYVLQQNKSKLVFKPFCYSFIAINAVILQKCPYPYFTDERLRLREVEVIQDMEKWGQAWTPGLPVSEAVLHRSALLFGACVWQQILLPTQ